MPESRPRAYRDMMQDLEFPDSWTPFSLERRFTAAEYERLAAGFPPGDMDDKWFIYLEDDTLYFHRNWTGRCIFKLRLLGSEGEYVATDALGANYPAPPERRRRYRAFAGLAFWRRRPAPVPIDDATHLNWVIDVILLGKPVPWLPPRLVLAPHRALTLRPPLKPAHHNCIHPCLRRGDVREAAGDKSRVKASRRVRIS